jgi:hypothetical protein
MAGFYIDLAVVDPDKPGRFLLGIECDGASYHSSRSARDRDRIRQQVLEDRGWIIHRVWSTDWFHRPQDELRKVVKAIEEAKVTWAQRDAGGGETVVEVETFPVEIQRTDDGAGSKSESPVPTTDYVEASLDVVTAAEIHEMPSSQLARIVEQIVGVEGPVHKAEITRRVVTSWGLSRAGSRIVDAVESAVDLAAGSGRITRSGNFFAPPGKKEFPIRNRRKVISPNLRKPEMLPPTEIRRGVEALVKAHHGASSEETIQETARLFGYKSTSRRLFSIISGQIDELLETGRMQERNGKLYSSVSK